MRKTLFIFDFDDTLVFSGASVHITHADGSIESLKSHDFAIYKEKPGDKFDYSEFDVYPPAGKIIRAVFLKLISTINTHGARAVAVLSARGSRDPMKQFLSDAGLKTDIEIKAVGGSNPQLKATFVDNKLSTGEWDRVEIYEDSLRNIQAIGDMISNKYPHVTYIKNHVQAGRILRKTLRASPKRTRSGSK